MYPVIECRQKGLNKDTWKSKSRKRFVQETNLGHLNDNCVEI